MDFVLMEIGPTCDRWISTGHDRGLGGYYKIVYHNCANLGRPDEFYAYRGTPAKRLHKDPLRSFDEAKQVCEDHEKSFA